MSIAQLIYNRTCYIYAISLLALTVATAQTQSIKGKVVDAKAKYSLIGASVILIDSDPLVGTITDEDGKFELTNIPVGRVAIGIKYVGYKSIVVPNILLNSGKQAVLNIELEESVEKLEGITVTAKNDEHIPINNLAKVSARTFSLEEVTRFSGGRNDVARLAATFAGVSAPSDARNDIVVRGNSPTGVLWRVEGIPIASTNHFATLGTTGSPVNALNTNVMRTSDFLTGAFPAEYGNANAAVFDINFRNGNTEKYEFTGQIAFTGVELVAEGPISRANNSSFLAAYRYGIAPAAATGTTAIPNFQDFSFKVDLGKSKLGRIELFGLGGLSSINFLGNETKDEDFFSNPNQDAYVKNQLGLVGAVHTLSINKNTYLKTSLGVSTNYNEYLQDNLIKNDNGRVLSKYRAANVRNRENRYTLSSVLNKKFSAKWSLRAGLLSELYGVRFSSENKNSQSIPDTDGNNVPDYFQTTLDIDDYYNISQLYAQAEYRLSNELSFTFGLHSQYHSFTQKFVAEPRIATSWQFTSSQRLSLAYGLHAQSISSPILFYKEQTAPNRYVESNSSLDFMKSHQVVLAYNVTPGINWRINTELYYQDLFDIPIEKNMSSYSVLNSGDSFAVDARGSLENKGTGKNYGVELTVEKIFNHGYYMLLTTSLYESNYKGSDGIERNTAFNNNAVGNLLAGKEFLFGKNKQNAIMLDTKLTVSGGKPQTPIDLEATRATGGREDVYIENQAYSERNSTYFRWDIKIGVRASIKKTSHEWFVEVQNVLDRRNQLQKHYSSNKDAIISINQIGIYPVFLYRIRF